MLKKTITYKDFNGVERTEDHYFHLTQAELLEYELVQKGGFEKYLQDIIDSKDGKKIVEVFKRFIKDAYGIRTEDGRSFVKTKESYNIFKGSEAYSVLFLELCTDADMSAAFVRGIVPADLAERAAAMRTPDGFRPGYDPSYRPTPPVIEEPTPLQAGDALPATMSVPTDIPIPEPIPAQYPGEEQEIHRPPLVWNEATNNYEPQTP